MQDKIQDFHYNRKLLDNHLKIIVLLCTNITMLCTEKKD